MQLTTIGVYLNSTAGKYAREQFDFIAVTDHWSLPEFNGERDSLPLLVIPGIELDGYDTGLTLKAKMTVSNKEIVTDFTGSSSVSPYGINVPLNYTAAYSAFGIRCGAGMRRGSIIASSEDEANSPALLPSFRYDCRYRPQFLAIYLQS